jgi:hypothetical protein
MVVTAGARWTGDLNKLELLLVSENEREAMWGIASGGVFMFESNEVIIISIYSKFIKSLLITPGYFERGKAIRHKGYLPSTLMAGYKLFSRN